MDARPVARHATASRGILPTPDAGDADPWHARMPLVPVLGILVGSFAVSISAAAVDGVAPTVLGVWLAMLVLAVSYRFGPKGVIPMSAASAAGLVAWHGHLLSDAGLREFGVLAAAFLSFGCLAAAGYYFLFRKLRTEHSLRMSEVEAERNKALELVREREELQRKLTFNATHDTLTRLANRELLTEAIQRALDECPGLDSRCAVMFLDLDDFKGVNDELGHAAGDELLRVVGQRLVHAVREYDLVARLGGDEFAVLFPLFDPAAAHSVIGRVLDALNAPITVGGRTVQSRASAGLAISEPDDDPLLLLGKADLAMYAVKNRGKDDVAVYEPEMHQRVQRRLRLESDLSKATREGQLRVYYQPIVSLTTGELLGFEALVRWQHPEHGLIPPDQFIPIAESSGAIVELGMWVLSEACRQLRSWQVQHRPVGGSKLGMAVNLSARQLADPDLVTSIRDVLAKTGVDPRAVTLEITESLAMDEGGSAQETLARLKAFGLQLAIDDFGTGYSSLSRLGQLQIDKVKIDKTFLDSLVTPERARAGATLIRASIGMTSGLGLTVVAEGIEDPAQVALLRQLGCDEGQGFLFGRPAPAEAFDVTMAGWPLPEPSVELLRSGAGDRIPRLVVQPSMALRPPTKDRYAALRGLVNPLPAQRAPAPAYTGSERRTGS